ncbi:MAG: hypothetical protein IJ467_04700 [Bacteroidaceae bacterium]|nr:hypothetical protein [Bacteroidaceae bacterium]
MIRLFLIFSLFVLGVHAQEVDSLLRFVRNIQTFNYLYPQEKVYLHFDNNAYFQGDTIWFAAYVVSAETLQPADLSRVLYVELLSEEGELVSTQRLEIEDGRCHGQIALNTEQERSHFANLKEKYRSGFFPVNRETDCFVIPLPSGFYEVRAYTRVMLNWGTDVCFSRVFPVFDAPEKDGDFTQLTMEKRIREYENKRPKSRKEEKVRVEFYPEGGCLIQGLSSRVAFKVIDSKGSPLSTSGFLYVNDTQLCPVHTIHDGMGSFRLTALSGDYHLRLSIDDEEYRFKLPKVDEAGIVLSVVESEEGVWSFNLSHSGVIPKSKFGVTVTCRGKLLHFSNFDDKDSSYVFDLKEEQLQKGINQVTVFDTEGRVYAERLFFVQGTAKPCSSDSFCCTWDKKTYAPFGRINLGIRVCKSNSRDSSIVSKRLCRTVSLSVRDGDADINTNYEENLRTNLLLTSDLKGYIHHPNYYFESGDSLHRAALDLLMLTQGWRRYEWKQLSGITPIEVKHFMEKGLSLDGHVFSPRKKKPLVDMKVSICITEGKIAQQWGSMQTDGVGRFTFGLKPFRGRQKMTLTLFDGSKLINARFLLNRHFSPSLRSYKPTEYDIKSRPMPREKERRFTLSGINVLEDVEVSRFRKRMMQVNMHDIKALREKKKDLGELFNERTIVKHFVEDLYDESAYPIVWAWMNAVRDEHGNVVEKYRPRNRFQKISETYIHDVDYILVYGDPNAHLYIDWNGIAPSPNLLFRTILVGAMERPKQIEGFRATHIDGYSYVADYYHPRYNREMIPGEVDYRRTLYWNPALCLDEKGEATVTFYNNSVCEEMVVSCEGL